MTSNAIRASSEANARTWTRVQLDVNARSERLQRRARANARANASAAQGDFVSTESVEGYITSTGYACDVKWKGRARRDDGERALEEARARRRTYAMRVSYDGTAYQGFQYQGEVKKTIQSELERCLMRLTGDDRESLKVGASGRTDSGVHARGQIVHFYATKPMKDVERAQRAMNGMLPDDIRVHEFWEPHELFHSRFHARRKTYWYYLDTRASADVFSRKYAHNVGWKPPDLDVLRRACSMLVGTMDYRSFCNTSKDHKKPEYVSTTRTIYRMDVVEEPGDGLVRIEVEGDGFLYRQVRNMVGALLVVATGRCSFDDFQRIIDAKDRKLAPMGAPAKGLFLARVDYPEEVLRPARKGDVAVVAHDDDASDDD